MSERETLEVDALIVGGGPAGLAAAYHLRQLFNKANKKDISLAVLEKGKEIGAHVISGAVMDPRGINELMPDWKEKGAPVEQAGVDIFAGFSGAELLIEDDTVVGVRTGDKGIDKHGQPKGNYEPGIDVRAKVTILAEGSRGSLTKQLVKQFKLNAGKNPQVYAAGVKEIWDVPSQKTVGGRVIHTMGWPLRHEEFGGGFIYNMADGRVSIGFVIGLDYLDPRVDPHQRFQQFKTHPYIKSLLEGGTLFSYGAKTIPEGGYWAQPQYYFNGGLIIGDSAGFLNAMRLKGIHMAFKTGMLAAQASFEAIEANDVSSSRLKRFEDLVEESWVKEELWKVRNFHQGFEHGFWAGMFNAGIQQFTGGRGLRARYSNRSGPEHMQKLADLPADGGAEAHLLGPVKGDGKVTFDKLTDLYHSGTKHEEDQPAHLIIHDTNICESRCIREY